LQGPWRNVHDVEPATLEWVHWHNNRRLHTDCHDLGAVEYEQVLSGHHPAQQAVGVSAPESPDSPGRSSVAASVVLGGAEVAEQSLGRCGDRPEPLGPRGLQLCEDAFPLDARRGSPDALDASPEVDVGPLQGHGLSAAQVGVMRIVIDRRYGPSAQSPPRAAAEGVHSPLGRRKDELADRASGSEATGS
jgi:hypothetical protein